MSSIRGLSSLRGLQPSIHPLSRPSRHIYLRKHALIQISPLNGRRAFSVGPAITTGIEATQDLMMNIHSITHLPWFITIPLIAFTVGATTRLPFSIHSRRVGQRRTETGPLKQIWIEQINRTVRKDGTPRNQIMEEVNTRQIEVEKRIHQRLGLQEWRLYLNFLGFPFWLLAIDSLRRLCGGPQGLLSSLLTDTTTGDQTTPAASTAIDSSISDPNAVSSAIDTASKITDPSLSVEGFLWFTDLTAADPYHILPFVLSFLLLRNLVPNNQVFWDKLSIARGRKPTGGKVALKERMRGSLFVGLLSVALMLGPITAGLPAALHLYWIASTTSNILFNKCLDKAMPIESKSIERCQGVETELILPRRGQAVGQKNENRQ
ncbi:hypothetical protein GGR57DRAFT_111108 [Xylariaceae sp. FL1272]|nr:hypothetical protein GGR57DRAFT_111108 [Xylariaceae sp. FL1272]